MKSFIDNDLIGNAYYSRSRSRTRHHADQHPVRHLVLGMILLALCGSGFAEQTEDLHTQIDRDIWRPFKAAFEALDAQALNALYSDDCLRVTDRGIDRTGAFRSQNLARFDAMRAAETSIDLDFWLDERHTEGNRSYNVGFFRVRATAADGSITDSYGQFHILLARTDGRWLIVQDWDSSHIGGEPITAKVFERGATQLF